jgi:transposase
MDVTGQQPSYADLAALVVQLQATVERLTKRIDDLEKENVGLKSRIAELEAENAELRKKNPTRRIDKSYSMTAEEKRRQEAEQKKAGTAKKHGSHGDKQSSERRGRIPNQDKIDRADLHELVVPEGFTITQCKPHSDRPVWRIRNGKATLVVYEIWRGPNGEVGDIEGVLPLSEFGLEIHTAVAFLVSMVGLSMDKVCEQLKFFWELDLSKSQADALLNQLSREWETEFESLCMLLAVSAVVHADETSWSLNSVWAFLSEKARVLIFGCRKDANTLAQILPKESFVGILVSDDAAVYQGFSKAQKCWAHLIRKAIRFTLLRPDNEEYKTFLNGLLDVYRAAKRASVDQRLKETGRAARVAELVDVLSALCVSRCKVDGQLLKSDDETDHEFDNLVQEIARLMCDCELFTFVLHPEAGGTNNEAERSLRDAAQDRRTGRTSKTLRGAQRRTILVSVLESLKLHLSKFTLSSVQTEIQTWWQSGESLFVRLLKTCGLDPPTQSRLNILVPIPKAA